MKVKKLLEIENERRKNIPKNMKTNCCFICDKKFECQFIKDEFIFCCEGALSKAIDEGIREIGEILQKGLGL